MNPHKRPINWTPERLKLLREYYPTMFTDALAKWIGCSVRTLQRKARELGLKKVDNFNQVRSADISRKVSDGVKRAYREGRKTSRFRKGVRSNPQGEFKPGFKFKGEIEEGRKEKIRETYRRKKLIQIYMPKTAK